MSGSESRDVQTLQATVDAKGFCTFAFPPPPQAQVRTGTLCVVDSLAATTWTLYLGAAPAGDSVPGIPLTTTLGQNVLHQVQQLPNDYLVVQASGLTPGQVYQCSYHAVVSTAQTTKLVWPVSLSQATTTDISGSDINATVTGPVTVTPEEGSTFTVDAGTVEVENATGTFLFTSTESATAMGFTGNGTNIITTTGTIPATARYLIIQGSPGLANNGSALDVKGVTSNIRYAHGSIMGNYLPLVVPVIASLDAAVAIVTQNGADVTISSVTAVSEPLPAPTPVRQSAAASWQAYSGDLPETLSFGAIDDMVLLHRLIVDATAGGSGYQIGLIEWDDMLAGTVQAAINASPGSTLHTEYDFGPGIALLSPFPAGNTRNGVTFTGNSASTAWDDVSITAVFSTV